ncbi:T9SS type A sorting domain-containing protein [Aureibaculum luteum]|uniref:T9SS type A sorting domain-containing protein n=1 Tax=Aureibaculum luteum TaxID=1548456 RepID=UPI00130046A7|nr:T9SS type A sorting domain-containing protein [Aureibaculum luteum]
MAFSLNIVSAQELSSLPLFSMDNLDYQGAFRIDAGTYGASNMNFAQGPLAYNSENNSIFIVGHSHHQAIAEFKIPSLVNSTVIADLNTVEQPIQIFKQFLNATPDGNPEGIDRIGGLYPILYNGKQKLIVNAYEYYDAPGDNKFSTLLIDNANNLENSTAKGYLKFEGGSGHTSGWISPIPENLKSIFGGTHITGQSSGIPIISRTSVGPSAFVFNMDNLLNTANTINTTKLLDFSLTNPLHSDLSNSSLANDIWTHLSRAVYGFIVPGTRTYVTIGKSGGHQTGVCYKCTQTNGNLCGGYCTPDSNDNYNYYWLWDLNDLLDVKNGQRLPYDVQPYAYGKFNTPFQSSAHSINGGSFDPITGNLYLSIENADNEQGTYANPPIIVVYQTGAALDTPTNTAENIQIYPNPTFGIIKIDAPESSYTINVVNTIGATIYSSKKKGKSFDIDLSSFANGMYFLVIENLDTHLISVEKILKK